MKKYNKVSKGRYNYEIAIGEYDEPRKQMQGLLTINLAGGNVAIMGQGGSGVESLISTMIFSIMVRLNITIRLKKINFHLSLLL